MSRLSRIHRFGITLAYFGLFIGLPMSLGQGCPPATTPPPNNPPPDNNPPDNNPPDTTLPPLGVDITIPEEDRSHVPTGQQVTYATNPPASGHHWGSSNPPAPAPAGFYDTALHEEQWVHNLEHGYVVILYDCKGDCSPELISDLEDLIDQAPLSKYGSHKLVITAYPPQATSFHLPYLITAVAWNVQMHLDHFDQQALTDFISRHVDHGPEDISQ